MLLVNRPLKDTFFITFVYMFSTLNLHDFLVLNMSLYVPHLIIYIFSGQNFFTR